jgi:preprotein translocase subunit Sss1
MIDQAIIIGYVGMLIALWALMYPAVRYSH